MIRYAGSTTTVSHINVLPEKGTHYNDSLPPDTVWLHYPYKTPTSSGVQQANKTYAYTFRGEIKDVDNNEIDLKVGFFSLYLLFLACLIT